MTKLVWDGTGSRHYEAGVDRGVYYPQGRSGLPWNGLTSVDESPSETDIQPRYIDGLKIRNIQRKGSFSGTIESFSCPETFFDNLYSRRPSPFGFSYRVSTKDSYKIHLVYNVFVLPEEATYNQDEAEPFSWSFVTRPVAVPEAVATSHLVVDASMVYPNALSDLENALYGSDLIRSRLPSPSEVFDIFEVNAALRVIDNEDGTFTVEGPDDAIQMLDSTTFQISWPNAVFVDSESYTIRSW